MSDLTYAQQMLQAALDKNDIDQAIVAANFREVEKGSLVFIQVNERAFFVTPRLATEIVEKIEADEEA